MNLNKSLLSKGMFAISALVIVQIVLFAILAGLHFDLKKSTKDARTATLIGDNLSKTYSWIAEMIKVRNTPDLVKDFPVMRQRLLSYFSELKLLLKPADQSRLQLAELEKDADEIFYWLKGVNTQDEIDRMVVIGTRIMDRYDKFIDFSEQEGLKAAEAAKRQQMARDFSGIIINIGIVLQVLLLACISLWMRTDIATRLLTLKDNLQRFADQKPLHPRVGGKDEIARLDAAFHKMAETVTDAAQKKKAIFDNASDVICRVNENAVVLAVNKACEAVLGYEPKDLIDKSIDSIILKDNRERARQQLAKTSMQQEQVELRVRHKSGAVIDTLWSVRWSEEERALFCVIHDFSARKQADRLRQEILQMVSHDLRTPLATVSGFFEMAEEGFIGSLSGEGIKDVKGCYKATTAMVELIRNLLDVEKIEAGMLELDRKNVPLSHLFDQSIEATNTLAKEHEVTIDCLYDAKESLSVHIDVDRCVQILTKLLSDAIKASPPNSRVVIAARKVENDFVEIEVIDEGKSVPSDVAETMFNPFAQASLQSRNDVRGSGMGLAVCRSLVEMHGGTIHATSEPGRNKFKFTLPIVLMIAY